MEFIFQLLIRISRWIIALAVFSFFVKFCFVPPKGMTGDPDFLKDVAPKPPKTDGGAAFGSDAPGADKASSDGQTASGSDGSHAESNNNTEA